MNKQIRYLLKVGALSILFLCLTISSAVASPIDPTDLEVFFDKIMNTQMDEFHIPNATVAVVANGEIVFKKGYGYSDLDAKIPVDPERTLFRIGSSSKVVTWTGVMQLVEKGKLDLDRDVNNYLDFVIPARIENAPAKSEAAAITLRHLMTHTAGFEDVVAGLFNISGEKTLPLNEYLLTHLPARIFPPGEVAAYSNYGTALAGFRSALFSVRRTKYIYPTRNGSQQLPTAIAGCVSRKYDTGI